MRKNRNQKLGNSGFSLVELSIVLVILGLLTGGILAGQALIRAAELRSVSTESSRWLAATQTFRDKFFAMPGDISNAESFWGTLDADSATCKATASTNAQTCNGDGDGNVEVFTARSREFYRYWQHLANAGLIEGNYNGVQSNAGVYSIAAGVNAPGSKVGGRGAAWTIYTNADIVTHGGWASSIFYPRSKYMYQLGGLGGWGGGLNGPVLRAEDAWNIDNKMDDGKPGTGIVTTFYASFHTTCTTSDTATNSDYLVSSSGAACVLFLGF